RRARRSLRARERPAPPPPRGSRRPRSATRSACPKRPAEVGHAQIVGEHPPPGSVARTLDAFHLLYHHIMAGERLGQLRGRDEAREVVEPLGHGVLHVLFVHTTCRKPAIVRLWVRTPSPPPGASTRAI